MPRPLDLAGRKQPNGSLTAIRPVRRRGRWLWECRCDCGATTLMVASKFTQEQIRSCGCLQRARWHQQARALRAAGWTLAAIARELGVSRQRVHQILRQD